MSWHVRLAQARFRRKQTKPSENAITKTGPSAAAGSVECASRRVSGGTTALAGKGKTKAMATERVQGAEFTQDLPEDNDDDRAVFRTKGATTRPSFASDHLYELLDRRPSAWPFLIDLIKAF